MGKIGDWVMGGLAILMSIGGLFVASNAGHGLGYYGGLGMFVFCVLFIFFVMKKAMDHADQGGH